MGEQSNPAPPPAASYSLSDPLPSEFVSRSSTGLASYRNYPVFSWPWLWRRQILFGIVALVPSFAGVAIALVVKDWLIGLQYSLRELLGWLTVLGVGPALATLIRRQGWPPRLEVAAIVVAIAIGMAAGFYERAMQGKFLLTVVLPKAAAAGMVSMQMNRTVNADPGRRVVLAMGTGVIYLSIGGGAALLGYFRQKRRWQKHLRSQELRQLRMQRDESHRRLTVLQAQVEPHFLFNTLASVRSLIKSDPRRAEATIDALVDHLRATLPKLRAEGDTVSTLSEQIEICRSYLEVMRVRMGGRMSFTIDAPATLHDCLFPPLMLISLVENAIKHGVEPKAGPCTITLTAKLGGHGTEQQVEVNVIDDGAGLKLGLSDGVGLSNIRAQLNTRYGRRASLRLEQRNSGGVIATLSVPYTAATA